jgi:hypothetical protein
MAMRGFAEDKPVGDTLALAAGSCWTWQRSLRSAVAEISKWCNELFDFLGKSV